MMNGPDTSPQTDKATSELAFLDNIDELADWPEYQVRMG